MHEWLIVSYETFGEWVGRRKHETGKMVELFLDFSQKRWNLQQNLQKFTIYWPLSEKPRASVYFKGACRPLLILYPALKHRGQRDHRGYVAPPPICGPHLILYPLHRRGYVANLPLWASVDERANSCHERQVLWIRPL